MRSLFSRSDTDLISSCPLFLSSALTRFLGDVLDWPVGKSSASRKVILVGNLAAARYSVAHTGPR
jgi:hypothetical protein